MASYAAQDLVVATPLRVKSLAEIAKRQRLIAESRGLTDVGHAPVTRTTTPPRLVRRLISSLNQHGSRGLLSAW
jgi:hypothetical protein